MNSQQWHKRLDEAVARAERIKKDFKSYDAQARNLAEDVLWLAENYTASEPQRGLLLLSDVMNFLSDREGTFGLGPGGYVWHIHGHTVGPFLGTGGDAPPGPPGFDESYVAIDGDCWILPPCDCTTCPVCHTEWMVCAKCQRCLRCHAHLPGCRGCDSDLAAPTTIKGWPA
jgi:hypothetical protein